MSFAASSRFAAHAATLIACASLLLGIPGCASHADRVRQARETFFSGDVMACTEQLQNQVSALHSDRDVLELDQAMAELFAGRPQESERKLRAVRDRFDDLEQKNAAEAAISMLTDDNRRAYAGEDYEKVMIRVMLALSSLVGDGQDAEAYSLQISEKQQQIIDAGATDGETNPKLAYQRVAVGAYLHGMLCEATHRNYDDTERSYAQVVEWQPDFVQGGWDLIRARQGTHSARGNGVLYVFAFVGRGPYKEAVSEIPTSEAMLIADRIISMTADQSIPPTLAPIQVPQVVVSHNEVDQIQIAVDGKPVGATQTITNVGHLAVQQYQAIYPQVMARAVARRAIKKAAVYSAKSSLDTNPWVGLAFDAAGVAWEATESADTRCWALLPDRIQVLRVELPAGEHRLAMRPANRQYIVGAETPAAIPIEDGRNTYVLACFPSARLTGQVLVSRN
jgi:hypothetical protein